MSTNPEKGSARLAFRLSADKDGKVHMSLDAMSGKTVEVQRPVTGKTVRQARRKLAYEIAGDLRDGGVQRSAEADNTPQQQLAEQEIDRFLHPQASGSFLRRVSHVLTSILAVLFQIFLGLTLISVAYKGVQLSSQYLWTPLHLAVLALYTLVLILGIMHIATERIRWQSSTRIREWFGPRGLLILPGLLLVTSAAVFASFTFFLHQQKIVTITSCPGIPASVSEGSLLDFYMWNFLKLVPLLNLDVVLRWPEPLCYAQSRVGFLILLFQGFVVIPIIATVRFYWQNRHALGEGAYVYASGPRVKGSGDQQ